MAVDEQFWVTSAERLYTLVFPVSKDAAETAAESAVKMLVDMGVSFSADMVNEAVLALAEAYTLDFVAGITATSKKLFQHYVTEWLESGEPLDALIELLAPVFGEVRAESISVTEVTRMFAQANNTAWAASGYVDEVEIRTSEDDLVCVICEPLGGTKVRLGQSEGYPPFHPKCRCWEVPVIKV